MPTTAQETFPLLCASLSPGVRHFSELVLFLHLGRLQIGSSVERKRCHSAGPTSMCAPSRGDIGFSSPRCFCGVQMPSNRCFYLLLFCAAFINDPIVWMIRRKLFARSQTWKIVLEFYIHFGQVHATFRYTAFQLRKNRYIWRGYAYIKFILSVKKETSRLAHIIFPDFNKVVHLWKAQGIF